MCGGHDLRRLLGETEIFGDNASAESLRSTFKREDSYRHLFAAKAELVATVDAWIRRDNARWRHSNIGQMTPTQFELASSTAAAAA